MAERHRAAATGAPVTVSRVIVAELELDLEVFSGPFDLLLTLVLREEVDLLEVELADVVVSYLDFLEARGELDLEVATEFLVLIAALLELKSRLMLPREDEELPDLEPGEAAEELLARMLEARRYRARPSTSPTGWRDEDGHRFRARAAAAVAAPRDRRRRRRRSTTPPSSARRSAALLRLPPASTCATSRSRASRSPSGCGTCARCCAAARCRSTRPCAAPTA